MVSRIRSPNCPSVTLGEAIDLIRKVYHAEKHTRFRRETLAKHLGFSTLNGAAISKIGAIRAFGLIEGGGDVFVISQRAATILKAPKQSEDYVKAIDDAFLSPAIFKQIVRKFGNDASNQKLLNSWLIGRGFTPCAAEKALSSYLASQSTASEAKMSLGFNHKLGNEDEEAKLQAEPGSQKAASHGRISANETEPVYRIQLSCDRWMFVQITGGSPMARDFENLEKFARFQRHILESSASKP